MPVSYWIGVVHLAQVKASRKAGFVGFSHGKEAAVRRVNPGDQVIFYSPKTDFDGDPVQAFVQIATITGETPVERELPGTEFRPWVRDAVFSDSRQLPVRPMLSDLSFVKNPEYWGMAFRRSLFEISEADFNLISAAMTS